MHPGHFHHYGYGRFNHGRPSRILWFFVGGLTATWWIKRKNWNGEQAWGGHCSRRNLPAPAIEATAPPSPSSSVPLPAQESAHGVPPQWGPVPWGSRNDASWEDEKEKMKAFGLQAADSVADLSEATLDSVLSTVETLKAKLAQNRLEREKERKLFEERLEAERAQQRRWV